jgi:ribosome-associated protein
MLPSKEELLKYISFKTSRSGGKGGQNVNKVSSKVELILNIDQAVVFSPEQIELLKNRLSHRIDQEGNLHVIAQEDRSQLVNKERSVVKLINLLRISLHVDKVRKPSKTPKSVIRRRLENKQSTAMKKLRRQKPHLD